MPLDTVDAAIPVRPSNAGAIEACGLFHALSEQVRSRLASNSFMAYAERGQMIWMADSPAEFCSIVGVGFVKTSRSTPNGQDVPIEMLGPGQVFGLIAVIEGRPLPLTATAVTNSWYLKIPGLEVQLACADDRSFRDKVVETLVRRLKRSELLAARLSSTESDQRIAAALSILADSYGRTTHAGIEIPFPLTRRDLADIAGVAPETTTRIMRRWQGEGTLSGGFGPLTIFRPEAIGILPLERRAPLTILHTHEGAVPRAKC